MISDEISSSCVVLCLKCDFSLEIHICVRLSKKYMNASRWFGCLVGLFTDLFGRVAHLLMIMMNMGHERVPIQGSGERERGGGSGSPESTTMENQEPFVTSFGQLGPNNNHLPAIQQLRPGQTP